MSPSTVELVQTREHAPRLAVVIPCFKVRAHVVDVIRQIGPWATRVYCVDDACPEGSGALIEQEFAGDERVRVLFHERNRGVGAAMITGYRAALEDGADVLIKIDGDGQMDPRLAPQLARPILAGEADYVKGNRFFDAGTVSAMPTLRLLGNAGLSLLTKVSTGYWNLFDATNGFTALHAKVARELPLDKLHPRYFFESDMLFRLAIIRAKIVELPMTAVYGDERSNLSELRSLLTFPLLHTRNLLKRILYNYFLRGFGPASLLLVAGVILLGFGMVFGTLAWIGSARSGVPASAGTVMLAALPTLGGFQSLLTFGLLDVMSTPTQTLHSRIHRVRRLQDQLTAAPAPASLPSQTGSAE